MRPIVLPIQITSPFRCKTMRTLRTVSLITALMLPSILAIAPRALADDTRCRGSLGPVTVDNLIVPNGSTCTLNGTRVEGNIFVSTRGKLTANRVRVDGNIQAEAAAAVIVNSGSVVGGNIQIKQGGSARIDRVQIREDLQFENNQGALIATRNQVGGNLQAWKNTGGLRLVGNRVAENLQCKENTPAPSGGNNRAGDKEDQCARL